MLTWDEAFDAARAAEIEAVCDTGRPPAQRAEAWRALIVSIAPHVERWATRSGLLRHCGLSTEDDARWVLVEVLERLSRRDHENLRAFLRRQAPVPTSGGPDAVDSLSRLCEAAPPDGDADTDEDEPVRVLTPFRLWLLRLFSYATRDHVRRRLGAPGPPGEPTRRGVGTDASRFETDGEPGVRPPITDWLTLRQTAAAVETALELMPVPMQAAVRLWLADASFDEIAAQVELPDPHRARSLVRAGVARLRERFREAPEART